MNIQFYAEKVVIEAESNVSRVFATNVDMDELIGQMNIEEVLESIKANGGYEEVVKWLTSEMEAANED